MKVLIGAAAAAFLLTGCGPRPTQASPVLDEKGSLAIAQQFGDAVLANQWTKAYALTTPEFQAIHPQRNSKLLTTS